MSLRLNSIINLLNCVSIFRGEVHQRIDRLFTLRNEEPEDGDNRVTAYLDGRVTLRTNVASQKIKGVIKEAGWQRIHPGDFAISGMNAHIGGMGVSDSLGKCSPIYLVLIPKQYTNAKYISKVVRYMAHCGAVKILVNTIRFNSADLKRDDLKNIWVWIPPLEEQESIVRYLDHVDRLVKRYIRAKQKKVKLLNEQKQAIIQKAVTRGLKPEMKLKPSDIADSGEIAHRIRGMSHSKGRKNTGKDIVTLGVRHGAESSQFSLRISRKGKAVSVMDRSIHNGIG